ncbi:hypothetical protein [Dyadobacter crusticola]|uniref:hypothetical protein n=1 Tax=Dyadobacter crusticola TaxID=292407 RepID=UPI0004E21F6B|nr:hypothetical protein [Dyadobacter crusticola]
MNNATITKQINAQRIQDLTAFMQRVKGRLDLQMAVEDWNFEDNILKGSNKTFNLNQLIMENSVTIETLAAQVRAVRDLQNKYFRIPKENKEEKQTVLRASKAAESSLDKMVAVVLDKDLDAGR